MQHSSYSKQNPSFYFWNYGHKIENVRPPAPEVVFGLFFPAKFEAPRRCHQGTAAALLMLGSSLARSGTETFNNPKRNNQERLTTSVHNSVSL